MSVSHVLRAVLPVRVASSVPNVRRTSTCMGVTVVPTVLLAPSPSKEFATVVWIPVPLVLVQLITVTPVSTTESTSMESAYPSVLIAPSMLMVVAMPVPTTVVLALAHPPTAHPVKATSTCSTNNVLTNVLEC